jgi:transforming growth factor-beta-induced protein
MSTVRFSARRLLLLLALVLASLPVVAAAQSADAPTADIVDTAIAAGDFDTLVAAVQAAGLVETLKGEGPFTVFAPTDDAFAALPAGTLDTLLADPSGDLTQILLYHVVPGKVMAADVTDGLTATTAQGGTVTFTVADGAVKINDATIIATDIETTNGVIHVIDAVILPPADAPAAEPVEEPTAEAPTGLPVTGLGVAGGLMSSTAAVLATVGALVVGTWFSRRRSS